MYNTFSAYVANQIIIGVYVNTTAALVAKIVAVDVFNAFAASVAFPVMVKVNMRYTFSANVTYSVSVDMSDVISAIVAYSVVIYMIVHTMLANVAYIVMIAVYMQYAFSALVTYSVKAVGMIIACFFIRTQVAVFVINRNGKFVAVEFSGKVTFNRVFSQYVYIVNKFVSCA